MTKKSVVTVVVPGAPEGAEEHGSVEERRSCFVAITRAHETLTLTRAREYFGWRKRPSQFLEEVGVGLGGNPVGRLGSYKSGLLDSVMPSLESRQTGSVD